MATSDAHLELYRRHVDLLEAWERESPAHVAAVLDVTGTLSVREHLARTTDVFAAPAYFALEIGYAGAAELMADYDELSLLAAGA